MRLTRIHNISRFLTYHQAKAVMVAYLQAPQQNTLRKIWMGTNLKMQYGVGLPLLSILLIIVILAFILSGTLKIICIGGAVLLGALIAYMYYTWKSSPIRFIHFRGMQTYSQNAGAQAGIAQVEGRQMNKEAACLGMASDILGGDKYDLFKAMVDRLKIEKGNYFKEILQKNYKTIFPNATDDEIFLCIRYAEQMNLGPTIIIGYLIEKTLGASQAVLYIKSLQKNELY